MIIPIGITSISYSLRSSGGIQLIESVITATLDMNKLLLEYLTINFSPKIYTGLRHFGEIIQNGTSLVKKKKIPVKKTIYYYREGDS